MPKRQELDQSAHTFSSPPEQSLKSTLRSRPRSNSGGVTISAPTPQSRQIRKPRIASPIGRGGGGKARGDLPLVSAITQQVKREDNDDGHNVDADFDQSHKLYDEFNLEGISPEELRLWSKLAPEGQKLEDGSLSPPRRRGDSIALKRTLYVTVITTTR